MRLFLMPLRDERDVVLCRNHARHIAAALQFPTPEQVRVATAISEIARNAFSYARDGTAEFTLEDAAPSVLPGGPSHSLVCTIRDRGPGIAHLADVLAGTYRSTTGLSMGIVGAKRLMDRADIESTPAGTTVRLTRQLPLGVRVTPAQVQRVIESLRQTVRINPLDELTEQNRELLRTLDEIGQQGDQLARINEELSETNRGVVALYDELDTVYRVGRVVAAKLDLASLLQAITDATTEVSGAEHGAFYHRAPQGTSFAREAVAGPLAASFCDVSTADLADLLGATSCGEIFRVDDLLASDNPRHPFGDHSTIRSYLAVPVCDSVGAIVGCLVFGHRMARMFSERSERILTSVAAQAAIGLENARLYHCVQSASAAKDQFLAMLSHELRTPLNPVFAVLSALEQDDSLSESVRADLLVMRRNLQLEARLIDDLLDLTRIVKGKVPLQLEVVDVHAIIRMARETCDAAIAERGVSVALALGAPRHFAMADTGRLQQVFWNLLNNAVKFTPPAGSISIKTDNADGHLCVSLQDTGRGINAAAIGKIFQPFEQGDDVIPVQFGGLGLGLAITKSIVDAHGGGIRAESGGLGHGATFVVSLPLVDNPQAADAPARAAAPAAARIGRRILLVDDHADTRTSLQRLLARRGHAVTLAGTVQEAMAQAAGGEFDLVISDLGLPDGNGHDLMRALHAAHAGLAGIALSGYGMETDIERSHAAGFAAHLTKPLDFAVLEAAIEKALGTR